MGVHGLWTLLEPVGKPVPLESLENKILAVDVSIWLHQATKGFRDAHGNPLPNAHLLGLCHRLCKLLFYKIKPIFVFDGGVPILKRQTIAARQTRRNVSVQNNNKIAEKILENYLKSEAINKELGGKGKGKAILTKKRQEPDLFELPPLAPDSLQNVDSESESSDEFDEVGNLNSISAHLQGHNIHSVDVTSPEFISLPPEVQHEILLELKDTRKQSSWNRINQMPQEAKDFSSFQMERLLKRRNLQQRLNQVEKEISRKKHAPFDIEADEITAQNIVSDSSKHYVLLKKALEKKDISTFKREENVKESIIRDEPEVNFLSEDSNVVAEDLTQEEILAIMKNDSGVEKETQEQNVVHHISSSEDDSDLEEVPTKSQQSEVVLSVPINPDELSSDEDMFADIFGKPGTSVQNSCVTFLNVTSSMDEETSYEAQSSTSVIGHHRPEVFNLSNKEEKFAEAYPLQSESNQQKPDASEEFLPDKLLCSKEADSTGSAEFVEVAKAIKLPKPPTPQESVIPGLSAASVASCESTEKICTAEVHKEPIRKEHIVTPEKDQVEASLAYHDLKTDTQAAERSSMEDVDVQVIDDSVNLVQNKFLSSSVSETQSTRPHEKDSEELFHPPQALDGAYRERLEEMDRILNEEQFMLVQERGRQERMATTLTDQIYAESQEMLQYFGIPYLVAPMEAEAQCAYLDEIGMTQGTITDDSDIWLFGGRRVYKNFFNQSKYVEYFELEDIHKVFKMKRQQLVSLALLTGSDYTEGLQGVGPVFALEIMAEFPGEGVEQLENFKEWLNRVQKIKNIPPGNKIRQKIRNLQLIPGFPNRAVVEAYVNPEVNKSREKFSWKEPDLQALRDHLQEKIGWNREKFNSIVVPVLERFKNKEYQTRIDSFFAPRFSSGPKAQIISKRVLNALSKADFRSSQHDGVPVETLENIGKTTKDTKKRRSDGAESSKLKRNKKATVPKPTGTQAAASSSVNSNQVGEKIWQREKDRQALAMNKLKAIETLKRSRGRGKRLPRPTPLPEARLSDSDSSSS